DVQSGAGSHVGECAVSVVAIKAQRRAPLFVAGPIHTVDEKNVLPAIAIVVEKGAAGAKGFRQELPTKGAAVVLELNACLGGHIGQPESGRSARSSNRGQGPQQRRL